MANNGASSPVSPLKASDGPPESPTTARPLDFDSDQETGVVSTPTKTSRTEALPNPPPKDEPAPPSKPPRPLSPREQAENTLKEAFPTIDAAVVRAVLTASGGNVEPAFNALLGMSDPDSQREPEPPAKPPRPAAQTPTSTKTSQLEADELYARQLAEHYSGGGRQEPQRRDPRQRFNEDLPGSRAGQGRPGASPNPDDVPWRTFIDDDLPEIRDNIRKGFIETQSTVNKWISSFKKKLDGEDDGTFTAGQLPDEEQAPPLPVRRSADTRRSADMQRYDADMQPIGDDFSKLDLRDGDAPPRTSSRPLANPNLFRPNIERGPSPATARKVSFQDGPPEEIRDMYSASPKPSVTTATAPGSGGKTSKWQPLASVDPSPVTDNDPFSLGDSDEEKDAKPITMKDDDDLVIPKETTTEDDQVKKATDEAMKEIIGGSK
ncbi:ubiquitin-binding protein cue5 [Elasticomyces elasticus]|uniref:Ubiquitin-binding protein cue5 n=1 Tax=Exophiala sideris TaxID=1016849 RepID=A0ABR0JL43_9EURO|nr:ubiquitin-binding protein cue5 [Elasticomyces elasticus]KAK5036310.1 ubiquitin-binding protein cue5 [Exophiala sideris]KAK5041859.1 ubiquitin-binding protein cue5 [Exophiala sideris]KAK5066693.1 ubiquitin-binding protein cue5 [Exophiala sideris]KAK5184751.1 ubiquitin-binding protein cue5 [Eurotiomycetes sp. CCFEE 6388]